MKAGLESVAGSGGAGHFSLGRSAAITDNESTQNSGFSGRIPHPEKVDSRDDARR
jgi:hypothetical protein